MPNRRRRLHADSLGDVARRLLGESREENQETIISSITGEPIQITPPETIPRRTVTQHFFTCPECHDETDWLKVGIKTVGADYGGYDVSRLIGITEEQFHRLRIDYDGDPGDMDTEGHPWWECGECGHTITYNTIMNNIHSEEVEIPAPIHRQSNQPLETIFERLTAKTRNPTKQPAQQMLQPNEEKYQTLHGGNAQMRHKGDTLPDAFSPEVIAEFHQKTDPYGYALTTPCPNCSHEFMIGPEDSNVVCPKCNHEFNVQPKRTPQEVGNAEGRRRRFGASFQFNEIRDDQQRHD